MEIKRATELGDNIQETISEIFVDAYGKDLAFFSKDKEKLIKAFTHMFVPEYFYMAILDNEIAGMIVCLDKDCFCINHDRKTLVKHLGLCKGAFANTVFRSYFNKYPKYPMELDEKTASVEFVSTRTKYKKRGVATAIMNYLFALPEYENYVLEVADTNVNAVELYKKLGYKEECRKKLGFIARKYSGVNYFVYMKYSK